MKAIGSRKALDYAIRESKRDITAAILPVTQRAAGYLLQEASADGMIHPRKAEQVQAQIGQWVMRFFVGEDLRRPYADDGVTPLAPYPRILNKWYVYAVVAEVEQQRKWMQKRLPADVYRYLAGATRDIPTAEMTRAEYLRALASERSLMMNALHGSDMSRRGGGLLIREVDSPYLRGENESVEAWRRRLRDLRIFSANPLAEIDPERRWVPMHRWQDSRGYTLSRRIWDAGRSTQAKIDALLAEAIRNGDNAQVIAARLESFLHPDRRNIRTRKPYGIDGAYDAMRLARSEIARAHNQAAAMAAYMNPYVNRADVARSRNGDPKCPVCPRFATIGIDGTRLREPYPIESIATPIFHPHCMCHVRPVVADDASTVTERLRGVMQDTSIDALQPAVNPAAMDLFIERLIGQGLMDLMAQVVQLPLL